MRPVQSNSQAEVAVDGAAAHPLCSKLHAACLAHSASRKHLVALQLPLP